jgi:hypothetical protein
MVHSFGFAKVSCGDAAGISKSHNCMVLYTLKIHSRYCREAVVIQQDYLFESLGVIIIQL